MLVFYEWIEVIGMARKGLNQDKVVEAAMRLMEEKGYDKFSLRELANSLGIKAASLYNHIENIDGLYLEAGKRAAAMLIDRQKEAIAGLGRREALVALAVSQRSFVFEHPELYKAIMALADIEIKYGMADVTPHITEPTMAVLEMYGLSDEQKINWQRFIRSTIHGFITFEEAGWFKYYPVSHEESYSLAVTHFADALEALAAENAKKQDGSLS